MLGRKRDPLNKNAPRTIDLDISIWDDRQLELKLQINGSMKSWRIPDQDITQNAHVVVPLAEVSPQFIHPLEKVTLANIAQTITGKTDFQSFFKKIDPNSHLSEEMTTGKSWLDEYNYGSYQGETSQKKSTNPVALITGASRRIGAAIVRCLHQMNFNVVVHYNVSAQEAYELVKELNR